MALGMETGMSNHFEGKKHAYRQTQDGVVISFVVHPNDVSPELATAALGTRFMVGFAEIGDNEEVIEPPSKDNAKAIEPKRKFSDLPLSAQCAMRCEDAEFIRYLTATYPHMMKADGYSAAIFVRSYCNVESRAVLNAGGDAADKWMTLERDYQNWLADQRHAESVRR